MKIEDQPNILRNESVKQWDYLWGIESDDVAAIGHGRENPRFHTGKKQRYGKLCCKPYNLTKEMTKKERKIQMENCRARKRMVAYSRRPKTTPTISFRAGLTPRLRRFRRDSVWTRDVVTFSHRRHHWSTSTGDLGEPSTVDQEHPCPGRNEAL